MFVDIGHSNLVANTITDITGKGQNKLAASYFQSSHHSLQTFAAAIKLNVVAEFFLAQPHRHFAAVDQEQDGAEIEENRQTTTRNA